MKNIKDEALWRSIIECHQTGMTASETATALNCSVPMCYKVSSTIGFTWKKKNNAMPETIRAMLEQGIKRSEIAKALSISVETVSSYQKRYKLKSCYKTPPITQEEASERIKEKCDGMIYLSGYKNNTSLVLVKCPVCGNAFRRGYGSLTNYWSGCQFCKEKEKQKRKTIQEKELEEKKRRKEAERLSKEIEKESRRNRELNKVRICVYCGKPFTKAETGRDAYCSDRCGKRMDNKRKETTRNQRLKGRRSDKDISLARLYKRDAGRCWICGMQCNYEDYTTVGNAFIAGNYYPSIDHVIPISKGGENTWHNIKLAHRICNTLKSNDIYTRRG